MNNYDRYISVVHKLRNRYRASDDKLYIVVAGKATRYTVLECMAAIKYLGCSPSKMVDRTRGLLPGMAAGWKVRK